MERKKINIGAWFIMPLVAFGVFGLTQVFIRYPQLAERYYSQTLYPLLASVISFISQWIPISIDDIFYLILILSAVSVVVLLIARKLSIKLSVLIFLNGMAAVYVLFYVLWGFNYFRSDLNARLGLEEHLANQEEFMEVFSRLVEATNLTYTGYEYFDKAEIANKIEDSYRKLAPMLKLKYPSGSRRAKPITLSGFFAQAGISGYFGPFFNEVHVNSKLMPVEYPFVLAHEKAHQFGITGESEANFYAWMVCSGSDSKQLQYSANLIALRYFMNHAYRLDGFSEIVSKIDQRVIADIRKIQQHWMGLRNEKVEAVASRMNDAYLKSNQVEKGIRDYTGIVKHIMDFSLDLEFQEKAGF